MNIVVCLGIALLFAGCRTRAQPVQPTETVSASSPDFDQKIRSLIDSLRELQGAQFWRNGKTYSASDAVSHLLHKYESSRSQIHSVDDFISQIATKSSMSGEPYKIILSDGAETPAADWFRSQAARMGYSSATIPASER